MLSDLEACHPCTPVVTCLKKPTVFDLQLGLSLLVDNTRARLISIAYRKSSDTIY